MWLLTYCFPSCFCIISAMYYTIWIDHTYPSHPTQLADCLGAVPPFPCPGMNKVQRFIHGQSCVSVFICPLGIG